MDHILSIQQINKIVSCQDKKTYTNRWYVFCFRGCMLFTKLFDKYLARNSDVLPEYFFLKSKFKDWNMNSKTSNSKNLTTSKLSVENTKMIRDLLLELDIYFIIEELSKMKIYYQINYDPRRPENKALYAKALCPKLGKVDKKKHIGINFGSLKKHPEEWTESNMQEARLQLIEKAFRMIVEA